MRHSLGDEPLTLTRYHSCGLRQLYKALEGWKSVCGRAFNLKGIKGKIFCFSSLHKALFLFYYSSFNGMMRADSAMVGGGVVS